MQLWWSRFGQVSRGLLSGCGLCECFVGGRGHVDIKVGSLVGVAVRGGSSGGGRKLNLTLGGPVWSVLKAQIHSIILCPTLLPVSKPVATMAAMATMVTMEHPWHHPPVSSQRTPSHFSACFVWHRFHIHSETFSFLC